MTHSGDFDHCHGGPKIGAESEERKEGEELV